MEKIFEIASSLSTPLALGGFFAATVLYVFRQIVAKNVFPQLSSVLGANILKLIIERLFMLALVAMVLGFVAYLSIKIMPLPITSVNGDKLNGITTQSPEIARSELGRLSLKYTPGDFVQSARSGDLVAVELFLKAGMNPNTTDDNGTNALSVAAFKGHTKIVAVLLNAGADIKLSVSGTSPLSSAASGGHIDSMRFLLDKNPDAEAIDDAFVEAVRMRHHDIALVLMNKGADVKKIGSWAMRVTAGASGWGDEEVRDTLKFLLDLGADPNRSSKEGWTVLMEAASNDRPLTVLLLLERGADVNAKCTCPDVYDGGGWTALMLAIKRRYYEVVKTLLDKGADVNQRNNRGETPLILAAYSGAQNIFLSVLNEGAEVNAQSYDGKTALMGVAAGQRWPDGIIVDYPKAVYALLEKDADVNQQDIQGRTSLMLAAESGSMAVVRTLLKAGANVNTQDTHGNTALRYAQENLQGKTKSEIIQMLKDAES